MPYPTKEVRTSIDDFFGPFMEKKLRIISLKIADELLGEFRKRLVDKIENEVLSMNLQSVEKDGTLKIIIEDKRI